MILGVLYLILVMTFGCSLIMRFVNVKELYAKINPHKKQNNIPELLFIISSGSIVGILITTFFCYYLIYFLNVYFSKLVNYSYRISIIFCCLFFLTLTIVNFIKRKNTTINHENSGYYIKVIFLITLLATFVVFYTYFMRGSYLYLGPTVHSDVSPHTALTEAFGNGANIPTSYMHFSNDGIRYHFMFYFFTGLLKYLKMPLDMALNIPTIIGIVCALVLVGLLANLISNNKKAFFWAPILILFRSSFDFIDLIKEGSLLTLIERIIKNSDWFHTTPYDEWGLWAINVYPNQRHLMFGVAILVTVLMLFMPYFIDFLKKIKEYKGLEKIRYFFLDKENWKIRNYKLLCLTCIIIMALPYFHGSVLISLLLILFGMAIFSENRLSYLIIAILAVCSSYLQTAIFSGDTANIVSFKFMPGFVLNGSPIIDVLTYLIVVTGITFILGFVYVIKNRKDNYILLLALIFLIPTIFGFLFQMTIEVLANHKFLQITVILFAVFVASFLSDYFNHKETLFRKVFGYFLVFLLTMTGICEWFIYVNMNRDTAVFNEKAEVTRWIRENTETTDTFLTPYWSMSEVYLAGRQIYYGWPYYAWSAGHDTEGRMNTYFYLLRGCDDNIDVFIDICKHDRIKYFVDTGEYYGFDDIDQDNFHRDYITSNLKLVGDFPYEGMRIYQIY